MQDEVLGGILQSALTQTLENDGMLNMTCTTRISEFNSLGSS